MIAESLNIGKTVKQVEDHYWLLYMGTHGCCLPKHFTTEEAVLCTGDLFPEISSLNVDENGQTIIRDDDFFHIPVTSGYERNEVVLRDIGKETGKPKDRNEINAKIMQMPGSEIPGYMPLRKDFEVEFENDAELALADMEFSPDDHPSERELKLQVIRIYNQKLEERTRRRNFVIERGLIDVKGQQAVSVLYSLSIILFSLHLIFLLERKKAVERGKRSRG